MDRIGLFLLVSLMLIACRKEKEEIVNSFDYLSAVDNNNAESFFNDMLRQADEAAEGNGLRSTLSGCIDTVIIDTNVTPHTMLIDFGPINCVGMDGRSRRGQLLVTFTGRYRDPGTVITIAPQGYHLNDHLIQGTKTVTNQGTNGDGNPFFSVSVDGSVTAPNSAWTATHQSQRTRTWVAGYSTPLLWDDVYEITGSGSGVNRNGVPYLVNITGPLVVALNCPWITDGDLEIIPDQLPARYVDFGDGTCDNSITVTVNGNSISFGGN